MVKHLFILFILSLYATGSLLANTVTDENSHPLNPDFSSFDKYPDLVRQLRRYISSGGLDVGNGGDWLFCKDPDIRRDSGPIIGFYSLDFVEQIQQRGGNLVAGYDELFYQYNKLEEKQFSDDSSKLSSSDTIILQQLEKKNPVMASSFREFLNLRQNRNPEMDRVWIPSSLFPPNIVDEGGFDIPSFCQPYQLVIRVPFQGKVFYFYSKYKNFLRTQSLQFSFLLVHEWLWEYLRDSHQIRNMNWYLHSKQFINDTPLQFNNRVKTNWDLTVE